MTYLVPVVAVIVGIVALGEPFEWRLIASGGLVIAGVAAVNERERERVEAPEQGSAETRDRRLGTPRPAVAQATTGR